MRRKLQIGIRDRDCHIATKILVVGNYDSFIFNLVQYLAQLGAECTVLRNDEVSVSDARNYDGVLISPGPGIPEAAGVSIELVKFCAANAIPLLGVCLGHQAFGVAFGGIGSRAPKTPHGKTSPGDQLAFITTCPCPRSFGCVFFCSCLSLPDRPGGVWYKPGHACVGP